ncbi:MAG: cupin domain-containing protein [Lachnospiraceae bacterium]|nr:cupin domain-containing protein [Lachnospiraceae bacterium]
MNSFDWDRGFQLDFDRTTGFSRGAKTTKRTLSQMRGMFFDEDAYGKALEQGDPLIYEFYELGCPERPGDLAFGTTVLYPGTVGDEYYMTKGHFHTRRMTSEVYYAFSGEGYMLLENEEGDVRALPLSSGQAVYVPRGYAHRTVNVGKDPLVVFFAFDADAGHDYGTIETRGYRRLILRGEEGVQIVPNPKWNEREGA